MESLAINHFFNTIAKSKTIPAGAFYQIELSKEMQVHEFFRFPKNIKLNGYKRVMYLNMVQMYGIYQRLADVAIYSQSTIVRELLNQAYYIGYKKTYHFTSFVKSSAYLIDLDQLLATYPQLNPS